MRQKEEKKIFLNFSIYRQKEEEKAIDVSLVQHSFYSVTNHGLRGRKSRSKRKSSSS